MKETVVLVVLLRPVQERVLPNQSPSPLLTVLEPQVKVRGVPKERKSAKAWVVQLHAMRTIAASRRREFNRMGGISKGKIKEKRYFLG